MFGAVLFSYLMIVQNVRGSFFDMTDVDDPLALLWHTKETIKSPKTGVCKFTTESGTAINGKCTLTSYCFLTGGKPHYGPCGLLATCCTYEQNVCGKISNTKVSYFESAPKRSDDPTICKHTIKLINDNICQIRLDFDAFFLSTATYDTSTGEFRCQIDNFAIEPNLYNIPKLCGDQTRHVYVHLDNSSSRVDLTVNLGTRSTAAVSTSTTAAAVRAVTNPQWRIKITQLECPSINRNFFDKHTRPQSMTDFPLLAPVGAIQYFTETHGVIRSFGFKTNGQHDSPYTSPQNYIMAFKRFPHSCRIRFTTNYIKTHPLPVDNPLEDPLECGGFFFGNELECIDETGLPCATQQPGSSKICVFAPAIGVSYVFTLTSPGPLHLQFVSKSPQELVRDADVGFDITYDLEHCDT